MRNVKMLNPIEKKESKPIKITHSVATSGWMENNKNNQKISNLTYLGKCNADGDMFVEHNRYGAIIIYKGHLNDGTY